MQWKLNQDQGHNIKNSTELHSKSPFVFWVWTLSFAAGAGAGAGAGDGAGGPLGVAGADDSRRDVVKSQRALRELNG